jgi:acyl-CoA thioesterase I
VHHNSKTVLRRSALSWCLALLTAAVAVQGCSRGTPDAGRIGADKEPASPPRGASDVAPSLPRVVALGDSLTAGLGIPKDQAYPALLQRRIDAAGYRYEVVNAGVSGDTSAGGLSRLDWSLEGDVRVLILALGGNDGLRGLAVAEMHRNLGTIIERAQRRRIKVLLAGMETPTNMGPQYQRAFHDVFPALAAEHRVPLMPFLLNGVAGRADVNQPDGIHPTVEGAKIIADRLWPFLQPLLATP